MASRELDPARIATKTPITLSGAQVLQSVTLIWGVAEVVEVVVTAGATSDGNVPVELNGVTFQVPVLTGDTTTAVATKLRAFSYSGSTTGGSGTTVTYTATSTGVRTGANSFPGAVGVTGNISTTTEGRAGDRVVAAGQSDATTNGIYSVEVSAWLRVPEWDALAEMLPGSWCRVLEGSYPGVWAFTNPQLPISSSPLNWTQDTRNGLLVEGAGIDIDETNRTVGLPISNISAGSYGTDSPLEIDDRGVATDGENGYGARTYIRGLVPFRHNVGAVWYFGLSEGAAYIPDHDVVAQRTTGVTIQLLDPSWVSTWVYLYASTGDVQQGQISASWVPAAPYEGYARSSTDFTTFRYAGAMRTDSSGVPYNFQVEGDGNNLYYRWLENTVAAPFRVLTAGTATSVTSVSCSAVVPPTSVLAKVRMKNNATAGVARIRVLGLAANFISLQPGESYTDDIPLTATRTLDYLYSTAPTGGGLDLDVVAFYDRR